MSRHANFFISAVTDEFGSYRDALSKNLARPSVTIETQKTLVPYGEPTLLKLDKYIQKCDAVIHLIGDQSGAVPSEASRRSILEKYEDLPLRVGLDEATLATVTYTQWEAWLAIYHGRRLFIAVPAPKAVRDKTVPDAASAEAHRMCQQAHLAALKKLDRFPDITFASRAKLCLALLRGKLQELLPPRIIPINVPPRLRPRLFKGRDEWLVRIRAALCADRKGGVDAICVALWGMGGLGKSRLAIEYAHKFAREHSALLMVTATTPENLTSSLADLTGKMRLPRDSDLDAHYRAALDWLDDPTNRGWLLLVDNVDDEASFAAVENLLGKLHHGCVIVTGRIKDWPNYVTALALDRLPLEHAIEYLLEATSGKRRADPAGSAADRAQARILAEELDGHALMLTQAAVHICKYSDSFAAYVAAWQGRRAELLDDPYFDPAHTGYPYTVAVTLRTSYAELPPTSAWVFDARMLAGPRPDSRAPGQPALATGCPCEPAAGAALGSGARDPRRLLLPLYDFCLAEPPTGLQRGLSIHRVGQEVGRIWQRRDGSAPARAAARASASSRLISCVRTPSSTSTSTSSPSAAPPRPM